MLYSPGDRLHLADLLAVVSFATDFSIGFSLRCPGSDENVEIGWFDVHLTQHDGVQKTYFRLCVPIELSSRKRIEELRNDTCSALCIPDSALYEIRVFSTAKSVLYMDDRECSGTGGGWSLAEDALLLDYESVDDGNNERTDAPESPSGRELNG